PPSFTYFGVDTSVDERKNEPILWKIGSSYSNIAKRLLVHINPNSFYFSIVIQCVRTHLTTESRLFISTEWRRCINYVIGIYPYCTSSESISNIMCFSHIFCP